MKRLGTSASFLASEQDGGASQLGKSKRSGILKDSSKKTAPPPPKVEQPAVIDWVHNVDRTHEDKLNKSQDQIVSEIDKLRARAFNLAKHEAQVSALERGTEELN